jgi:chromosome partitioning protein
VPAPLPRSAPVLTILNLKGGVGKTHTAWLLASVCQERGKRVLLVDLDAQANLTSSFIEPDDRPGVEAIFDRAQELAANALVRRTEYAHIDLIPASPLLTRFDASDEASWKDSDLHGALAEAIGEVRSGYDLVILDCPPRLSLVSFAALCASDGVLIPLEAADWGAQGIMQVTSVIEHVQERYHRGLKLLGYMASRYKGRRSFQKAYLERLRAHFGALAFDTVVDDRAVYEKSVTARVPLTLYAPRSRAADTARALFDEVERRLTSQPRSRVRSRPHLPKQTPVLAR